MAKLPDEQRCQFLIGPVSSWFMPNTSDIWSQPRMIDIPGKQEDDIDCDEILDDQYNHTINLSYFIYGSIGCFCYGQIYYKSSEHKKVEHDFYNANQSDPGPPLSAVVNRLIDIKEDNSRVACVRFLKSSHWPMVMVLTETGSLIIHDCLSGKNLVHFRKSEMIAKFIEPIGFKELETNSEHCKKKPKFNVTQQINSCLWADAKNAFLGFSLLKEKIILLFWLKMKDLTMIQNQPITKLDLIESYERLELNLGQYSSPICCMECKMLDSNECVIAVATDDGLITVVKVNLETGQSKRIIKLPRHNDQICSLSLFSNNPKKFPLGLLASVSRDGLTLIWDIENEFNFADYQATSDGGKFNSKINWFTLAFIESRKDQKRLNLALSNPDSGLTLLEIPENARSKIRLKGRKQGAVGNHNNQTLRHHALLFNVAYDSVAEVVMTSSLDGNHLFWNTALKSAEVNNQQPHKTQDLNFEVRPQYLYPSMPNNSRTHMLRCNPIKEDLIGMAIGKAGIRFYNASSNPHNNRFDMSASCGMIARKITKLGLSPTSIAWHPSNEYRIAIGTLEGKVLRADLVPRRATMIEAEHKEIASQAEPNYSITNPSTYQTDDIFGVDYKPLERKGMESDTKMDTPNKKNNTKNPPKTDGVYSICWGPNPTCPQDISRLAVYAIGSITNRLFIYHKKEKNSDKLTNFLDEFMDESLPEAMGESSEVAWKSNMDLMALGTTNGKIVIVSYPKKSENSNTRYLFNRLAVVRGPLGNSYIQCLTWHPTTDKDDHYYYFMATSANESPAFVFNLRESLLVADVKERLKIEDTNGDDQQSVVYNTKHLSLSNNIVTSYVHKLEAHKKAISDIVWSPHRTNQIATSSFDRHAHVWTLTESSVGEERPASARVISTFVAKDRLFTMEWSLVDEDLIFTSGHDSTVWAWRSTENQPLLK